MQTFSNCCEQGLPWKSSILWLIELSNSISSVQFSHSVASNSLQPHEPQHTRPPCPTPTPGAYPNSCPLSGGCHPTISCTIPSFFLKLFLHWSPVSYWAPTNLGSSSFSVLSFCLFILFMGFSRQEYWSGLPLPSPVDRILVYNIIIPRGTLQSRISIFISLINSLRHLACPGSYSWRETEMGLKLLSLQGQCLVRYRSIW